MLEKEVIYFSCGTLGEEETARAIASIVVQTLVAILKFIGENIPKEDWGKPKPHAFLFIDEAQEIGAALHGVLSQARKWGCSAIFAHQTSSQLKNVDSSLPGVVQDNTSTKMLFSIGTEEDIREVQNYSKFGIDHRRSFNRGGGFIASGGKNAASESESEYQTPLTDRNRILETSASKGEFYLITDQDGHREPIRTQASYTFTKAEYLRQLTTPMSLVGQASSVSGGSTPQLQNSVPQWQHNHCQAPTRKRAEHLERVAKMMLKIRAEHTVA